MSGHTAYTSTNRFQVTDQGKLREILSKCCVAGDGARPPALDSPDDGGLVAFHCPGSIEGYPIPRDEEDDCNLTGFLHDISGILAPGQACIITEARHGRKHGANGSAIVVCPGRRIKYLDLGDLSVQCARKMLEGTDCGPLKQESEDRT